MPEPVDPKYVSQMNDLARLIDKFFNAGAEEAGEKKVAFVLLLAEFGDSKRCNYISNADRRDCTAMMKEVIARFQGQPQAKTGRG
jgi:hypothetical protein